MKTIALPYVPTTQLHALAAVDLALAAADDTNQLVWPE